MADAKKKKTPAAATVPKEKKAPKPRKKKGEQDAGTRGLQAREVRSDVAAAPSDVRALATAIETDGGQVLAPYRDPFGGTWVVMAALPIDTVEPTPFQRNLSDTHVARMTAVIGKIERYLDPIIAVRDAASGKYWTPNGYHRLSAMKRVGARAITALVIPDEKIAYQILALNTEKAHTLGERALEVIRMYRHLAAKGERRKETEFELEFDEPAYITLGACYEKRPRFSGGGYQSMVKKCDELLEKPLVDALAVRDARAAALLAIDDVVAQHVEALKKRGIVSSFLKNYVIGQINPMKDGARGAIMPFDEAMTKAMAAAKNFDPSKVNAGDLAKSGGPPPEAGE